jgi:hypothetical protein
MPIGRIQKILAPALFPEGQQQNRIGRGLGSVVADPEAICPSADYFRIAGIRPQTAWMQITVAKTERLPSEWTTLQQSAEE